MGNRLRWQCFFQRKSVRYQSKRDWACKFDRRNGYPKVETCRNSKKERTCNRVKGTKTVRIQPNIEFEDQKGQG